MAKIEAIFEACLLKLETGATIEESLKGHAVEQAEIAPLLFVASSLRSLAGPVPARTEESQQATRAAFLSAAGAARDAEPVPGDIALEASLAMLAGGATTDECVRAFPRQATELRSSLDVVRAMQLAAAPAPPREPAQIASQRQAFLAVARERARQQREPGRLGAALAALAAIFRQPAWRALAAVLLLLVTFFGVGGTALTLASDALPGDTLYPVKLAAERARVAVTLDDGERARLLAILDQRRRQEAEAVVSAGRQVEVQFPGVIESMVDGVWTISGMAMPVFVPGDAEVIGMPATGRQVLVTGYSDGQGRLIARRIVVFGGDAPPPATATATATPARAIVVPAQPPDTATATSRPQPTDTVVTRPTATATLTATPTLSATVTLTTALTATPTTTPSGTPTVSPAPSATLAPYPGNRSGLIEEKHPTWWLVDGFRVLLTPDTVIDETLGAADVGAEVLVEGIEMPDPPAIQAALIRVTRANLEWKDWTGTIRSMNGNIWLVGDTTVDVSGASISGTPIVGAEASVRANRRANEMWRATTVTVAPPDYDYVFGTITSISGNIWVVNGQTVNVANAQMSGAPPRVGLYAEILAIRIGGQLFAVTVNIPEPTPTPTAPATPTPTGTPSATPSDTPADPTATATATPVEPTATPTATVAPPTSTPTEEPPIPTATPTPLPPTPPFPTPTATPGQPPPTSTPTPMPTLSFTPPPPPTPEATSNH